MVLIAPKSLLLRRGLIAAALAGSIATPALADESDRAPQLLEVPKDYAPTPIRLGPAVLEASLDLRGEYDDNIYALPSDKIGDFRFSAVPHVELSMEADTFRLIGRANAVIRRYADNKKENSEAGELGIDGSWRLSPADTVTLATSFNRAVEERGEPESRLNPASPPRESNIFDGLLGYKHQGARITLGGQGTVFRNNALSAADRERDYSQYSGQVRIGYRASGTVQYFAEGFFTRRDFSLATDLSGVNRDSRTIGTRGGIAIDPGGLLSGEASLGFFHFNPDSSALKTRTGVSAAARIAYQPTPRLALTLDGFRGDVATVRTGAQSRTDTRLRLGIQQEIYHNLHAQVGLTFRRTTFLGSGARERTLGAVAELEYLMNRHLAVAVRGRIADRNSTNALENSERTWIGLELRTHL